MSGQNGGQTLDQLPDEDDLLPILDDDIEVSFVEEAAQPLQRRGQNEDQDDRPYSARSDLDDIDNPKIRDRIMRERRLKEESEERSGREIEQMEIALLNSEKSKLSIQKDAFKLSLDGVDVRVRTATEALKLARQDGDVGAETDIEAQLRELHTIRGQIASQMDRLPGERDLDRAYQDHVAQRKATRARPARSDGREGIQPLNDKAGRWQSQNAWMGDTERVSENAALLAINNQLVKEGYDASDDQFFTELSKRMSKSFPSLAVKDLAGRQLGGAASPQRQQQHSAPVAAGRTTAPAPARGVNQRQVQLDKSDAAMMRMMRLDPSDKKALNYYAKVKFDRLRNEGKGV